MGASARSAAELKAELKAELARLKREVRPRRMEPCHDAPFAVMHAPYSRRPTVCSETYSPDPCWLRKPNERTAEQQHVLTGAAEGAEQEQHARRNSSAEESHAEDGGEDVKEELEAELVQEVDL